jgi:MurNAc alpha-1-phosphate uridylyltransferase
VHKINQAMIMAAGLGTRMRPLTDKIAKPMIEVNGVSLIEYTLHKLFQINIELVVINLHHHAKLLQEFIENLTISKNFEIIFSHEIEQPLEAGGTIMALPYFSNEPFFIVNSDVIWDEPDGLLLDNMAKQWDSDIMDLLMSLQPKNNAYGHDGNGDYNISKNNQIIYNSNIKAHDYIFSGARITTKKLFEGLPVAKFHFFKDFLFKKYLNDQHLLDRTYGVVHKGRWFDIGNTSGLLLARQLLEKQPILTL